ncbi:hypothetical protein SprV_0301206200 [Sparganum proliferum]
MADLVRFRGSLNNMNPCLNGRVLDLFALYNEVISRGGSKKVHVAFTFPSLDPDSYSMLWKFWKAQCHRSFDHFWSTTMCGEYEREFLDPTSFADDQLRSGSLSDMPPVLELQDTMSYYDVEGYRVQLVATVFRNLVVNSTVNSAILGQDPNVLRFVCLCIYSRHNSLHQLGLDIMSFLHFPVVGALVPVLKRLLDELLNSPDRVDVARGLRILRHLCESPLSSQQEVISGLGAVRRSYVIGASSRNFSFLVTLPTSIYSALMRIIYLRDLHLLILALDAVFALSSQGPLLCKLLLGQDDNEASLLDTLISHLTFEPQSFGSESLIRMRVMQVPGLSLPPTTSAVKTTASRLKEYLPESSKPTKFVPTNDLTSGLLLAPLPQPPAGCFAVPVSIAKPVRTAGITNEPETPSAVPKKSNAAPKVVLPPTTQWTNPSTVVASVTSTPQSSIVVTCQASSLVSPVVCYTSEPTSALVTTHHTVPASQAKVARPTPPPLAEPSAVAVNGKPQPASNKSCETKGAKAPVTSGPIYLDAPKDRREFAMFWLNKNYQVHPQSSFPRVQIYADYQKAHQQNMIPGSALSAGEFHIVIKSMFPLVDQVKVLVPNGNVEIHYNKLKHVDAPEPLEQALGVQHIIAPFLTGQHADTNATKNISSKSTSNSKVNKKRNHNSDPVVPSSEPKQARLADEGIANRTASPGPNSPLVNGQSTKLLALPNGMIELPTNGLHQHMGAAPALVISRLEGLPKRANGISVNNGIIEHQHIAPASLNAVPKSAQAPITLSSPIAAVQPTPAHLVEASSPAGPSPQQPHLLQFRTLIPPAPLCPLTQRAATHSISLTSRPVLCASSQSNTCHRHHPYQQQQQHVQRPPSLIVQSADTITVSSHHPHQPQTVPQTLTCLGTLVTAPNSTTSHQVFVYSLATPSVIPISVPTAAPPTPHQLPATISQPAQLPLVSTTPTPPIAPSPAGGVLHFCRWGSCAKSFTSADQLFSHVYSAHFLPIRGQESTCKWLNCREKGTRASLTLLNHLHEQHCTKAGLPAAVSAPQVGRTAGTSIIAPDPANGWTSAVAPVTLVQIQPAPTPAVVSIAATVTTTSAMSAAPVFIDGKPIQPRKPVTTAHPHLLLSSPVATVPDENKVVTAVTASSPAPISLDAQLVTTVVPATTSTTPCTVGVGLTSPLTSITSATTVVCSTSTPDSQPDFLRPLSQRAFLAPGSSAPPSVTHAKMQSVASTPVVSAERFRQSVRADFLSTAREGPVTKHIRLTAALILHNLTTFCASTRKRLIRYEPILCELAFAGTEASSTLSKCLSQCYESLDLETTDDYGYQASNSDSAVPSAFAGDDLPETVDQAR